MNKSILLPLALSISACSTNHKPDANYVAYVEAIKESNRIEQSRVSGIASLGDACRGEARCVENVAAMAALSNAAGSKSQPVEQYHPQQSFVQQLALGLVGNIAPLANAAVSWHQADTNARVSMAQYRYLDHVLSNAVNGMANTAIYSQPNVNVSGDYVSGQATIVSGHIGDIVGRDLISGYQHTGDTAGRDQVNGTLVGNDQIGRDRTDNAGIIHLGDQDRYTSPNDDHQNNGCLGSDCSDNTP